MIYRHTEFANRVMNWGFNLQTLNEVSTGMNSLYGSNTQQISFILGLLGLLHDIGYADLNMHSVPKWLHAISSGIMVNNLLTG